MNKKQIELLIRGGEGLHVEFKESYSSKIVHDIVAFSNTKGGSLLLGVKDDGAVTGLKLTGKMKADITSLARNCDPGIIVTIAQIDDIVVIEVPEGAEKPYSCSDGYFRRLDGVTQKMTKEELRFMFSENDPTPYEGKKARGLDLKDISRYKVSSFANEAGIDLGKTKPADFLKA